MVSKNGFKIRKGYPTIIGATVMGNGVNFAVEIKCCLECDIKIYSKDESIEYKKDKNASDERTHRSHKLVEKIRLDAKYRTGNIFCVFIENFDINKYEYSYEVMGRELIDPCSKMISGRAIWGKPFDKKIPGCIRSQVVDNCYNWEDDVRPCVSYEDAIFYKLHVRGYTRHHSSKVKTPGTFMGLTQKIKYIKSLGITSVILMPCYDFDEIIYDKYLMGPEEIEFIEYKDFLEEQSECEDPVVEHFRRNKETKGFIPYKINYWGYGVDNNYYFAPKASFASNPENAVNEFKDLIKQFHKAGLECIMEFNFQAGISKQFVYECFRYWMIEYHVDGFKFNANAINGEFVAADPLLGDCKLICEGWNEGAIYKGNAPISKNLGMMNDEYMVNVRKLLKGDEEQAGDFAYKFRRNSPNVGVINYITNANGFTLNDLYSYDVKHNEMNYENGIDGTDYNYSWNCGVEGKTRKSKVLALRKKQIRNALTILLLSQGSPLILAGDELLNTQYGNNNAYCQDNDTAWINWSMNSSSKSNLEFVKNLILLRKNHKILHMKNELRAMDYVSIGCPDLSYHGTRAWYPEFSVYSRTIGIMLYGKYAGNKEDSSFYIAINMHWEDHNFDIPRLPDSSQWECILDCDNDTKFVYDVAKIEGQSDRILEENNYNVKARNIVVFEAKPKKKDKCNKEVSDKNKSEKNNLRKKTTEKEPIDRK